MRAPRAAARRTRRGRGRRALIALALALVAATSAPAARAQCGANRSQCSACHDSARAPYAADAAWHKDHGFADVCAVCHGGVPDATVAAAAHVGLLAPLAGDTQCVSCHGDKSAALARRYARDAEQARAAREAADGGATPRQPPGSSPHRPAAPPSSTPGDDTGSNDTLAAVLAVLVGVLGLGWVASRERATLRRWRDSWMRATKMSSSNDERS